VSDATPPRPSPSAMVATVERTERLTRSMVRVVLGGPGLATFVPSPYADSYVKAVFLPDSAPDDLPLDADGRVDLGAVRAVLPADEQPRLRSYTVRRWQESARELTLDFVVHGDVGVAGPWAAGARPGDRLLLVGPGGAYSPSEDAAWHLFVADESALPAVAVTVERLPRGARAVVFVEVDGPTDELPLLADHAGELRADQVVDRGDVELCWIHRGDRPVGQALVAAVRAHAWPDGSAPHAFVHGEAGWVKEVRAHLRIDRGLPAEQLSISGYWRLGTDDEGWRARKREWLREAEEREAAAGVD
jgi:NADPH-dependent ferric siderophore reductase